MSGLDLYDRPLSGPRRGEKNDCEHNCCCDRKRADHAPATQRAPTGYPSWCVCFVHPQEPVTDPRQGFDCECGAGNIGKLLRRPMQRSTASSLTLRPPQQLSISSARVTTASGASQGHQDPMTRGSIFSPVFSRDFAQGWAHTEHAESEIRLPRECDARKPVRPFLDRRFIGVHRQIIGRKTGSVAPCCCPIFLSARAGTIAFRTPIGPRLGQSAGGTGREYRKGDRQRIVRKLRERSMTYPTHRRLRPVQFVQPVLIATVMLGAQFCSHQPPHMVSSAMGKTHRWCWVRKITSKTPRP